MKTETVLSILIIDGKSRMTCIGCTERLHQLGMVTKIKEVPINPKIEHHVATIYEIAPPYALESCRSMIKDQHKGPPWGSH